MPKLRTDDAVRGLRAKWLGPPGYRWPFDATYVEWLLGAGLTVVSAVVLWICTTVVFGFPYNYFITLTGAPCIGGLLTWLIRPHIELNTPVSYWWGGLSQELRNPRTMSSETVRIARPKITRPDAQTTPSFLSRCREVARLRKRAPIPIRHRGDAA